MDLLKGLRISIACQLKSVLHVMRFGNTSPKKYHHGNSCCSWIATKKSVLLLQYYYNLRIVINYLFFYFVINFRFVTYVVTLGLTSGQDKILCGDLMFSGHTVVLTIMYFTLLQYTPRRLVYLRSVFWIVSGKLQ